jgi:hypothetical protein
MARTARIDYEAAERKYVTDPNATYASIAKEFGVATQTIGEKAKREDWKGKRMSFQSAIARRSYEKVAEGIASEASAIRSEAILVARATLRRYATDIAEGKQSVSAKDAAEMIRLLVGELAPDNSRDSDAAPIVVNTSPRDADLLRRVVEAARERATTSGRVGDPALGGAERTRPN